MRTINEVIDSLELMSRINYREKAANADILQYLKQLRDQPEIIRCKDCRHFSCTTIGMPYACWRGGSTIWGETGEHQGHHCCIRVDSPEHFCSYAEKRGYAEKREG